MIIPTQAVEVLEHLWKHSPKSIKTDGNITQLALAKRLVDIGFDAGTITIQFGSVTVVSRLVQGTPPNWPALIPTPTTRVKFFAPDLLLAVSRLKSIAKEGSGIARLMWSGKTMKVSAQGESKSTESEIDLLEPSEGKIAMNHVYLRRYLKDKQSLVEMGTTDISSPILFQDGKSTVVVMPMFVQWDGEPVKEEKTEAPETAEETTAEGVSAETPEPKPAAKKKKAKSPRNKSTKTTKPKRKAKKA
jgi:DNA polymerase III sliding clamp (beta) subunit (PCNA family)